MAGFYDLMLLVDPNAPEDRRTAAISEAESLIGAGGTLAGSYDWGQRRMAFEIDHRPEADYRLYQFEGDNALLDRLNQRLRINDAVLRFRIIKAKPGAPVPPAPDQQALRRRDEGEAQDTKVAARAAADAPAAGATGDTPAPDAAPADAAAAPPAAAAAPAPPAPDAPSAPPAEPPAADAAPAPPAEDSADEAPPAAAAAPAPPAEEPAVDAAPAPPAGDPPPADAPAGNA